MIGIYDVILHPLLFSTRDSTISQLNRFQWRLRMASQRFLEDHMNPINPPKPNNKKPKVFLSISVLRRLTDRGTNVVAPKGAVLFNPFVSVPPSQRNLQLRSWARVGFYFSYLPRFRASCVCRLLGGFVGTDWRGHSVILAIGAFLFE